MKQVVHQPATLSDLGGIQPAGGEITALFIKKGILCLFRGMKVDFHHCFTAKNSAATCSDEAQAEPCVPETPRKKSTNNYQFTTVSSVVCVCVCM